MLKKTAQLWCERPTIDLDLNLPVESRYAKLPGDAVGHCNNLLKAIMTQIPPASAPIADGVRLRTEDRFHPSAVALGQRHGRDWRDVILANVSYDLFLASLGCSTLALPTPSGPVVARNMDWFPENLLARASYLIRYHRSGKLAFAHAAFAASIGTVTGLSAKGFAVIINAVRSPEGVNLNGYPVLLFLRKVLEEAENFRHALELLSNQTLAMSALLTVVGSENDERVVIERTPTRHALRWSEPNRPLMTTNHYRKLYAPEESKPEGCTRFERLCEFLDSYDAKREPVNEDLLSMLSDPGVIQEITAQHILIRPRQQQMQVFVPSRLMD
jgi:hypothetical protein